MRGLDSSAAHHYQHENLTNHFCTPPRARKLQAQQHRPNSKNRNKKNNVKRSLLSRASKQLKQKISKEDSTHDVYAEEDDTYNREARDPSPTNEMKYSALLNNGENNHSNVGMRNIDYQEDRWRGQRRSFDYQGVFPPTEELGIEFANPHVFPNHMKDVVISTTTFPNQLEDVVVSPGSSRMKSSVISSPITEKDYEIRSRTEYGMNMHMRDIDAQRHQLDEAGIRNMEQELNELRSQLTHREQDMENETTRLREELRKQKEKMDSMEENSNIKSAEYTVKIENDLETYKRKCTAYREQLLQRERENAKVEQALYNERRKVLSLESENETLINVAEEKVGNAVTSEKAKTSELMKYKNHFEKHHNEISKVEQALQKERKKVLSLEALNETLTKVAEEKVENAMALERAKSSELKSCMEKCEKHRERILVLESKVISMEGALNATSSIAKTLEEEKTAMSSELSQAKAKVTAFESETSQKNIEIGTLQSKLSNLESKCAKLEETLSDSVSNAISLKALENKNASLLEQLNEKAAISEKLEKSAARNKQLENENTTLKKKVDDFVDSTKENSHNDVFSSNTERLRKMLSDSESFISSLQEDLSSARTDHHRQLAEIRAKYSSEIDGITTQLESQIAAKRELEVKNTELEGKVLSAERNFSEIEELHGKLRRSNQEISAVKRELASKERTMSQLRGKIQTLEDEKIIVSSLQADLSSARTNHQQQLAEMRAKYSSEIDGITTQLEAQIAAKRELESKNNNLEDEVMSLERKLSEAEYQGTHQTKAQSEQMFKLMEHADVLRKKLSESSQEISVVKRELASKERKTLQLQSKIQALGEDKAVVSSLQADLTSARNNHHKQLGDIRARYSSEIDGITSQLEAQIAAKRELESKNNDLGDKVLRLEKKLSEVEYQGTHQTKAQSEQMFKLMEHADVLRKKLSESSEEMSTMKRKLVTNENTVVELRRKVSSLQEEKAIITHDMQALQEKLRDFTSKKSTEINELKKSISERDKALAEQKSIISSDNTEKLQQIEGLKHLKVKLEAAREENDMLQNKIRRKEKEIGDIKRGFESDNKAQEARIASKDKELQSERTRSNDFKQKIEKLSGEVTQLQRRGERIESELKNCRDELTAAKEESNTSKNKLSEATREYQDKTSELTSHYMKIEDEIRMQLKTTQLEKDSVEKKLAAEKKETDRLIDEFYVQKQELTSRVAELTDQLDTMLNYSDSQQRQEEALKSTIATKEKEAKELQHSVHKMKDQLESAHTEIAEKTAQYSKHFQHGSGASKTKIKPILVNVDETLDIENEVNATPSNHKKKKNNRRTSFQFDESPRAKAKGNAAFALGSPRAPLTPRTPRAQRNVDSWITPRTPRLQDVDAATVKSSLGYSKSEESQDQEMWEPSAWLYIT